MGRAAAASGQRDPFAVDEGRALAEVELAWADGGYHAFSADGGTRCAISSAGDVLTGRHPGRAEQGDPGALAGDAVTPGNRPRYPRCSAEPDQVPRLSGSAPSIPR